METTTATLSVQQIARICHEANRFYCIAIGDASQKSWEEAEDWQKDSAIAGVQYRLDNPDAPPSAQHDSWKKAKEEDGWKYGEVKDPVNKLHPCMVSYDQLPEEQRKKDALFQAVVDSLAGNSTSVTISVDHYYELKKDQGWLRSLEGAGVDNWDGYDHARESFRENYPEYNYEKKEQA